MRTMPVRNDIDRTVDLRTPEMDQSLRACASLQRFPIGWDWNATLLSS
jgi:hypothetical protein